MRTTIKPFAQWTLFLSLMTVGMFAFLVMGGEENPESPMSLTCFVMAKTIALAVFVLVFFACKYLYRKGVFPEWVDRCANEED